MQDSCIARALAIDSQDMNQSDKQRVPIRCSIASDHAKAKAILGKTVLGLITN